MVPTDALRLKLRQKLGEVIPEGGSAADTMFTDEQINLMLTEAPTITHAIVEGWEIKIAEWASLVNVNDGASARAFSDLMEHGENRLKYYRGQLVAGPGGVGRSGRTRIGKIIRHG